MGCEGQQLQLRMKPIPENHPRPQLFAGIPLEQCQQKCDRAPGCTGIRYDETTNEDTSENGPAPSITQYCTLLRKQEGCYLTSGVVKVCDPTNSLPGVTTAFPIDIVNLQGGDSHVSKQNGTFGDIFYADDNKPVRTMKAQKTT